MTEKCTYTGRYDRIHPVTVIRHRPTGRGKFETQGEDTLAALMMADAERVKLPKEEPEHRPSEKQRREQVERACRPILAAMQPGKEYLARDIAAQINEDPRTVAVRLTAMRRKGRVVGIPRQTERAGESGSQQMTFWRLT